MTPFGVGGCVRGDDSKSWVRRSDFLEILEVSTSELGLNYIDTAESYFLAESTIGRWMSEKGPGVRDSLRIGTKLSWDERGASSFAERCDGCLRRLRTTHVDVLWLHGPPPRVADWDDVLRAMDALVRSGKARYVGICNVYDGRELDRIATLCKRAGYVRPHYLQLEFHLLFYAALSPLVRVAASMGLHVMGYSPLACGTLAGRYAYCDPEDRDALPAGSRWRDWGDRFPPEYWTRDAFAAIDAHKSFAAELGHSPASLALAWHVSTRRVRTSITGPRRVEHLVDVRRALANPLSAEAVLEVEGYYRGLGVVPFELQSVAESIER